MAKTSVVATSPKPTLNNTKSNSSLHCSGAKNLKELYAMGALLPTKPSASISKMQALLKNQKEMREIESIIITPDERI